MIFEENIGVANLRIEVSFYWKIGKKNKQQTVQKRVTYHDFGITFRNKSFMVLAGGALAPLGVHKGSQIEF